MNEFTTLYQATLALVGLTLACLLYSLGGRSGKWQRRFVASFILASTVNGLCAWRGIWSPYMLTIYPALIAGFSMGYGSDIGYIKFVRRLFCALAICGSGLILCLILGGNAWMILPLHVGVAIWTIWIGIKNPLPAAAEEVFICALLNLGLMMYGFTS